MSADAATNATAAPPATTATAKFPSRRYVVAIDGSDTTNKVFSHALADAHGERGDELLLVFVVDAVAYGAAVDDAHARHADEHASPALRAAAAAGEAREGERGAVHSHDTLLASLAARASEHGVAVRTLVVQEFSARDALVRTAAAERADVLVVGSHSKGLIERVLLGSVSEHCVRNAQCSVMVVR